MKKFKINGLDYECDDKFNYAAMDSNGEVWVYVNKPCFQSGRWDPDIVDDSSSYTQASIQIIGAEKSLVEI